MDQKNAFWNVKNNPAGWKQRDDAKTVIEFTYKYHFDLSCNLQCFNNMRFSRLASKEAILLWSMKHTIIESRPQPILSSQWGWWARSFSTTIFSSSAVRRSPSKYLLIKMIILSLLHVYDWKIQGNAMEADMFANKLQRS